MIKIGLVGAGGMGTVHRSNFAHIENTEIAAVVETSPQNRPRAEEWGVPLFSDIPEMLKNVEVDIVDVCTPTYLHPQCIAEAIAGGRSVITEKPLALSLAEAKAVFTAADAAKVSVYVAHVLQFYRESEVLHELVKSGEYGKVIDAYFVRLSACPRWAQGGWLFDRAKSGHVPFDLHIHDLDLIVSLFGKPKHFSLTSCGGEGKGYREHYRFTYSYDGMNVSAEAGWLNADIPFTAEWRVCFEKAVVTNRNNEVIAYSFDAPPRVFDTEDKIKIPTGINVPPTGTYLTELTHFIDCWKRGVPSDRVSREQVLTVLEILEHAVSEETSP